LADAPAGARLASPAAVALCHGIACTSQAFREEPMNVMSLSQAQQVAGGDAGTLLKVAAFLWSQRETLSEIASAAALEMADLDAECGKQ
jgi:hypothetical protein